MGRRFDIQQTRDMVYVGDVAAANIAASSHSLPPTRDLDERAYNIGTGRETSVNRLAELIQQVTGRATRVHHAPERSGEIRRNALNPGKAARELQWRPETALVEGLHSTVRALVAD